MDIEKFPKIKAAAQAIAYDNGKINRFETEDAFMAAVGNLLDRYPLTVQASEDWLCGLSDTDLDTYCTGEHEDVQRIGETAPARTDELMDAIFEL